MEFVNKSELLTETLSDTYQNDYISMLTKEIESNVENLTKAELFEKLELLLIEKTKIKPNNGLNSKILIENRFILAQFYFDTRRYIKAYDIFDSIKYQYYPAMFQLGIILYDDLLEKDESLLNEKKENKDIDTKMAFNHPNKNDWKLGFEFMLAISHLEVDERNKQLIHQAQYNVGKAYYQGFGVQQSDKKAEEYWIMSADDGRKYGCVKAMTALAFFYSRKSDPEYFDLKKAYFWHNEACGNGSLESQGALGAMYYFGVGCNKDYAAAYECLTESSERGNVYSMGLLCDYYYKNKFYIKAVELAKKVSELYDIEKISKETNCLKNYITKGIGLACFTMARCLDLGKGVEKDSILAKKYYTRSYHFDPDICQLYQNLTTYQLV